jgi:predicted RNA-binding Zn-ribbon protein involved in translation (DUF1610 family)
MAYAFDADPRFGRFGLRSECPSCGAHLPVNGPAPEVECADCGEQVKVPPEVVRSLLDVFEEGWPRPPSANTETVGDMTWRWTAEPSEGPLCPSCQATLPHETQEGMLSCSSCRATVPQVRTPSALRKQVGSAAWVIAGEVDQSRTAPAAPVALACPSCGAGLSITSRHHRVTPCDHCGSRVHLPDTVWRALHPPRKVQPWWVRFEGESRPARKERESREEDARKRARAEEKAKQRAEKEARRQEEDARKAEEKAEADRQRARAEEEAARARAWTGYPVVVLAGLLTTGAWGLGLFAGLFFFVGHTTWIRSVGLTPLGVNLLEDAMVVGTIVLALLAWVVGNVGATRVAGTSFLEVLPWCFFMLGLSAIPFVGPFISLFFALQHFGGAEPTVGTDKKVPRLASAPLGVLYLGIGPLVHLTIAAFGRTALGGYLH